jgi:3-oxoacyl-[acyl-carrier protein] reductase
MSKLTNKVALVTGGSRGIGRAIAKRLGKDGASVAITYAKDAKAASAVVKAIEAEGGKAVAIQADAADVEAVRGAVEQTVVTFGRLDVLVNNADEVAALVAFVAGPESSYITGANLTVDGGMNA